MSPGVKLTYFPLKALGEPIRWLLKYGEIEFEDVRVDFEDWVKVKPTTPFGQLPFYDEGGQAVNQSMAISRYLAKRLNLVGDDDWEDLEIDAIVDTVNDLKLKLVNYCYEKDQHVKEKRRRALFDETLPFYLDRLEQVAQNNVGHLALARLTWADFYFVGILDYLNHMAERDITDGNPHLKSVRDNVNAIPAVANWIRVRPETYM